MEVEIPSQEPEQLEDVPPAGVRHESEQVSILLASEPTQSSDSLWKEAEDEEMVDSDATIDAKPVAESTTNVSAVDSDMQDTDQKEASAPAEPDHAMEEEEASLEQMDTEQVQETEPPGSPSADTDATVRDSESSLQPRHVKGSSSLMQYDKGKRKASEAPSDTMRERKRAREESEPVGEDEPGTSRYTTMIGS